MKQIAMAIISRTNSQNQPEYLLIKSNKDYGQFTGFYYPSGGHIEEGETIEHTLIRELGEELNLNVKPISQIAETTGDFGSQTFWWECQIISGEPKISDPDIDDFGFFTNDQMKNLQIWPATHSFFEKYISNND